MHTAETKHKKSDMQQQILNQTDIQISSIKLLQWRSEHSLLKMKVLKIDLEATTQALYGPITSGRPLRRITVG